MSKEEPPCETLWISAPANLFGSRLTVDDLCESNNLNAFSRAVILALALSALLSPFLGLAGFLLIFLSLMLIYGRWIFAKILPDQKTVEVAKPVRQTQEGFASGEAEDTEGPIFTRPGVAVVTRPTAANPFMNVLLDELQYNPTRPSADYVENPNNKVILDDFFRTQWFSDPTDVFGRTQGQRQFYTMPSTSIPNDQASYQNWLYLIPGKTCKEGGRDACYPGTNGGPITILSQPN